MGERMRPANVGRMRNNLKGIGMEVLSNGNGSREVSVLGRRREVDISGKNGEAEETVIEFLRAEFGLNGETAEFFVQEICEMGED